MSDTVTATGLVATEMRKSTTSEGLRIVSFRLASSERRFNKTRNAWEYTDSNWFTVVSFRHLAENVLASVDKGDRVVVTGKMRIRNWTKKDGTVGTNVEITADAIGHDLTWGTSAYTRSTPSGAAQGAGTAAAVGAPPAPDEAPPAPESASGFLPDESSTVDWPVTEPGSLVTA